ncbi:MAG: hypothetical protein JO061_23095 [Acidobacteriaceae bacterium]|nr:hypothetical protein [Acidobacteriaceae bacterium]
MIDIDREHADFRRKKATWQMYRDLYAGGEQFKLRAGAYLLPRQKEPLDVYSERLSRVFYQNYVGSIIDWYASTLFRRALSLQLEGGTVRERAFLSEFADDCDRRGTTLGNFFRRCLIDALVTGQSHILVDFPRADRLPANRAEEDASGLSRAYLLRYSAEDLINWSCDEQGEYEWIVLRQSSQKQLRVDSPELVEETRWQYYDREQFRVYRRLSYGEKSGAIELIAQGPHALMAARRIPMITLRVSDGLWLMNKAAHLQLEHFNKSNALGWAITMGLFAMPVIYSDREWNQIVGESYYVQLGPQDRFGWAEPDGKVYQIAAANLETLKEEIYRVSYLSQASGEMIGGHAQSAASKQLDFTITEEVLRAYGSAVKECAARVMNAVTTARKDNVAVSIAGLDEVDITDFGTELGDAKSLMQMGIESPTLKRQVLQGLALKYLSDARQDVKDQIAREINEQFSVKLSN